MTSVAVRAGDVWEAGEHRVACGDSGDAGLVGRLFGDEQAD